MGDFEDVFGAGADAVDIIDSYSRAYERSSRKERGDRSNTSPSGVLNAADRNDGNGSWSAAMAARGYIKGPHFPSYEELSSWDSSNTRPHVRSRSEGGYQVYFTDGQPDVGLGSRSEPDNSPTSRMNDDVPF